MKGIIMLQSAPGAKGVLHSIVATLYAQLGCNSQEPGEEHTQHLLEVLSEGGRFVKVSELAETEGKEVVGVDVSFDTYHLAVFTNMHTSTQYSRKDWCCLIPASEFEIRGPDVMWFNFEEMITLLSSTREDFRIQCSLSHQDQSWNLNTTFSNPVSPTGKSTTLYLPGEWRFREKHDEPTVFVPRNKDEKINYIRVFF